MILLGSAALTRAQSMSEAELRIHRRQTYARGMMDEIEKKLLESPDDGKFGMSRLIPMFVLKVHGKKGKEIFGYDLPGSPEGTRADIHTLGLFDQKGSPTRVARGSQVQRKTLRPDKQKDAKPIQDGLDALVKSVAAKLYKSGSRQSWTSETLNGEIVYVMARSIHPRKECLSCHKGAQLGKTMGVATVSLLPIKGPKPATPPPSKR
jgi:hypothetical protein